MSQSFQDNMLDFYRAFLKSVNVSADEENAALAHRATSASEPRALIVEQKRLLLPTRDNMRNPQDDALLFHPLSEAINRGESPVLHQVKGLIITKISTTLLLLTRTVLHLALSKSDAVNLTGRQISFISQISPGHDLRDTLYPKLEKVIIAGAKEANSRLCTIYIKRDAKQYGTDDVFKRAAIVNFPLIRELLKEPEKIQGQSFAGYERKAIANLFGQIVPNSNVDDEYSVFANPTHAPSFSTLLQAWIQIAVQLNKTLEVFADHLPDSEASIDLSWMTSMSHFGRWVGIIPPQPGNEGDVKDVDAELARKHETERVARTDLTQDVPSLMPERPASTAPVRTNVAGDRELVRDTVAEPQRRQQQQQHVSLTDGNDLLQAFSSLQREEERRRDRAERDRDRRGRRRRYDDDDDYYDDDRSRRSRRSRRDDDDYYDEPLNEIDDRKYRQREERYRQERARRNRRDYDYDDRRGGSRSRRGSSGRI